MEKAAAYETVELRLAETGTELWQALEAAQYARAIHPDAPQSPAEAREIARFVDGFEDCAERWQELALPDRAVLLGTLSARLDALERCGLFVHWGTLTRSFGRSSGAPVELPLAIVTVSRTGLPTARILLPSTIEVQAPEGAGN